MAGPGDARAVTADPAPGPPPSSPRGGVVGLSLRLCGVLLLAAVLWRVPWRDRVHLADGTVVAGRLAEAPGPDGPVRIAVPDGSAVREIPAAALAEREGGLPAVEPGVLGIADRLRAGPTLAVLGIMAVSIAIAAFRWRMLLGTQGIRLPPREALQPDRGRRRGAAPRPG